MICYIHACTCIGKSQGSYRVLNSEKILEMCPAISQTWKKSSGFFFEGYNRCFISEIFFVSSNLIQCYLYICSTSWKKLCSCIFLRSLLIAYKYLITVSLENETIVLEKVWEKSWIFYPKICTNPESTSPLKHSNLYLCPCYRIYWWLNVNKNWFSCWTTTVACASI